MDNNVIVQPIEFGEYYRDATGIYLINGVSAEELNNAMEKAVNQFKDKFVPALKRTLENFSVAFYPLGDAIGKGIASGIKDINVFSDSLQAHFEQEHRRCRAESKYMRMCANMPPPRKRKHGGRWPKRRRK